jgi:hypothetical protein
MVSNFRIDSILNMVEVNTSTRTAHRKYLLSPERLHTCMSHNSGAVIKKIIPALKWYMLRQVYNLKHGDP